MEMIPIELNLQYSIVTYQISTHSYLGLHPIILLRLRPLELDERGTLYRVTQENSIESSAQNSLPYIPRTHGPCWLFLTYPKQPCVYPKVNMCSTCCMTSSFQNLLHSSVHHVTCDRVM